MSSATERGSFDELVAGISSEERKFLLAKLNRNREEEISILQPAREETDDFTLDLKLRRETLLYRFFLWLRTLFTKKSKVELYNSDLLLKLARRINKNHPGIIDVDHHLLHSLFYEKLKELKVVAEFFKPYIAIMNENPGKFYVFLGTFIAPGITAEISKSVDPYQIPFEREATNELRASLLRRMDSILKEISPRDRTKLYNAVRGLQWLRQFTVLPYLHFIAQFTAIVSEQYTCPYVNAEVDFGNFASILTYAKSISNEALEALFLFPQRKGGAAVELDGETENSMREYLSKAASNISMIQMFISTVPMSALGKVVYGDYDWKVEETGGGEDWFMKYKEEWKVFFDARWAAWLRDRKKAQLTGVLKDKFDLDSFPELEVRPWAHLWGGITFHCEMTAGFLAWFAKNKYQEIIQLLNVLILEGVFINNENRAELSEGMTMFSDTNQAIQAFDQSLAPTGSFGEVVQKLIDEHVRTMKGQSLIDSMIVNAEGSIRTWEMKLCDSIRTIERVLHGVLDEEKVKDYDSIQNLMTIKGRENRAYREKLSNARECLLQCKDILAEIEPLDMPPK